MNKRYLWLASALLVLAGCAKSVDPVVEPKPAAKANDPPTLPPPLKPRRCMPICGPFGRRAGCSATTTT